MEPSNAELKEQLDRIEATLASMLAAVEAATAQVAPLLNSPMLSMFKFGK